MPELGKQDFLVQRSDQKLKKGALGKYLINGPPNIYCYISLLSRMRRSHPKNLTCPHCWCVATAIIHHQPIRLYNGVTYNRNISQEVLGQSKGHFCSLCHLHCFLHETVLGTFDTTEPCTHIFAMNVLYN